MENKTKDMKKYMKDYNKKYYLEHKEKIKVATRRWTVENPERVKGYVKKINNCQKTRDRKDEWVMKNKKKNAVCKNIWRKENYNKNKKNVLARNIAQKISLGKECGICKSTKKLERHHWRYDKPLLVSTMCKDCHTIQHINGFNQSRYAGGISFGR